MADDEKRKPLNKTESYEIDKIYESLFHNDRKAADIGIFCLKAVLVLNGAASIALISMHEIIAHTDGIGRALAWAGYLFLGGLGAAGVAAGIAYGYQRAGSKVIEDKLLKIRPVRTPRYWPKPVSVVLFWIGAVLCVASFGLFICGGVFILTALKQLATSAATGS